MKAVVLCEESQTITSALRRRGWDAYSCDIIPTSGNHPEWHIQMDAIKLLNDLSVQDVQVDLIIAHPPCTYLSNAGARYWEMRRSEQKKAISFVFELWYLATTLSSHIAFENPAGILSSVWRKPDQYVHPWQFGEPFAKQMGFWLYRLPLLKPTEILERPTDGWKNQSLDSTGKNRGFGGGGWRDPKVRSKTFQGIANAIADQWGKYIEEEKTK